MLILSNTEIKISTPSALMKFYMNMASLICHGVLRLNSKADLGNAINFHAAQYQLM